MFSYTYILIYLYLSIEKASVFSGVLKTLNQTEHRKTKRLLNATEGQYVQRDQVSPYGLVCLWRWPDVVFEIQIT